MPIINMDELHETTNKLEGPTMHHRKKTAADLESDHNDLRSLLHLADHFIHEYSRHYNTTLLTNTPEASDVDDVILKHNHRRNIYIQLADKESAIILALEEWRAKEQQP